MKRKILIIYVVIGLFVFCYFYSWFDVYRLSNSFYETAQQNMADNKPALALKGGFDFKTQEFTGGYQQIIEAWSGKYIFPQPKIYKDAMQAKNDILQNMSIKEIDAMVKKYIKTDKVYLPEALFRKAELLAESGKKADAEQVYNDLLELFPLNSELTDLILQKQEELKK